MEQNIIDFAKQYVQIEYETFVMHATEADQEIYAKQRQKLAAFSQPDVQDGTQRPKAPDEGWLERGRKRVKKGNLVQRPLFQIKWYIHPMLGDLYRIYLGSTTKPRDQPQIYNICLFASKIDNDLKIISRYGFNRFPERNYDTILEEKGLVWVYESGVIIKELGRFQESIKFEEPGDRLGVLADYQAQ